MDKFLMVRWKFQLREVIVWYTREISDRGISLELTKIIKSL